MKAEAKTQCSEQKLWTGSGSEGRSARDMNRTVRDVPILFDCLWLKMLELSTVDVM